MAAGARRRRAVGGVGAVLRSFMGVPYQRDENGALQPVDSIDLIIVGLGLVLILLVLLRR